MLVKIAAFIWSVACILALMNVHLAAKHKLPDMAVFWALWSEFSLLVALGYFIYG